MDMLLCLLPPALVLTPSHRDWMLQHKDLLLMLPTAMVLDIMASVMLMLTLPSSMEDMLAMDTLLCLLHPALVLTPSHKDLMPLHKDLLLMLPTAMVLDTMASVMLMLTLPSSMEDMLAMDTLLCLLHPALVLTPSHK